MDDDDIKIKEHEGIEITVSPITGSFSCTVFEEEYKDTDLWKLQELISELHTKKADMEEVFVIDYLYDLIPGRIKSFDYEKVYVKTNNYARTDQNYHVTKVLPSTDKNKKIHGEVKAIQREIKEFEKTKKTEIHKLMQGMDKYMEDHFKKQVIEQKKVKKK